MTSPDDRRAILVGDDTLTIECGRHAVARGWSIACIVSDEPRVLAWAEEAGVPAVVPGPGLAPRLEPHSPAAWLLSIANLRVLPDDVLQCATRGGVNFHDGPLPERAGLNAPAWAIIERANAYGITWHVMETAVDRGPILHEVRFELPDDETAVALNMRCFEAALGSFDAVLDELESHGTARARAMQAQAASGEFRTTRRDDRPPSGGVLDFRRSAVELDALVRGLDFGRYDNPLAAAKILLDREAAIVTEARAVPGSAHAASSGRWQVPCAAGGALEVLGLATLDGTPLDPGTLTPPSPAVLGDAAALDAAGTLHAAAARHEPAWRRDLLAFEPSPVPLVAAGAPSGAVAHIHRSMAVGAPRLAAAAAAVLWRLGTADAIGITVDDADAADADPRLFTHRLPLTVEIDDSAVPLGTLEATVARRIAAMRARGPRPRDLVARMAAVRGKPGVDQAPLAIVQGVPSRGAGKGATTTNTARRRNRNESAGRDLTLHTDGARVEASFDGGRFRPADVERLLDAILAVGAAMETAPHRPLASCPLVTPEEHASIVGAWNDTARAIDEQLTVHGVIVAALRAHPDAAAVVAIDGRLSARELDERSAALARSLAARGIGPGDRVGIATSRRTDLPVAVLAVLRAGAAYVPLDPEYPAERLEFMRRDAGLKLVIGDDVEATLASTETSAEHVTTNGIAHDPASADPAIGDGSPSDAAYVIYTSGSTGRPKGVVVEHGNVINFFAGMDDRISVRPGDALLAVTSLSFDISVLELLWTLARGITVVLHDEAAARGGPAAMSAARARDGADDDPTNRTGLSLYFWGNDDGPGAEKYALLLDAARFADAHGFEAVWTPERHFHAFGGPYPNPSVTSAALAALTERVDIRAGSCVVPLHHPLRVAEEWAMVDNLSDGRVGISFASGWQADDFVLRPESYDDRKEGMFRAIDTVQRLWRGEAVAFDAPDGTAIERTSLPRPVQEELPTWVTAAGSPETFRRAGAMGAHMLTHLLGQSMEQVAEKVRLYRQARADAGHDPDAGRVTLMLHAFVGDDRDEVRALVRKPMKDYLASATALLAKDAWAFPAFKRPDEGEAPPEVHLDALSAEEMDELVEHAFERYFSTSGLFGTVDDALETIARATAAGVDEIACLVDYGVAPDQVRAMLPALARVREATDADVRLRRARWQGAATQEQDAPAPAAATPTLAELLERERVTHLQCTPSQMRLLLADEKTAPALRGLREIMVGGEPFPPPMAAALGRVTEAAVTNMYGPTETTIWSTTARIDTASGGQAARNGDAAPISIGTPIANTATYILDRTLNLVPPGLMGTLWIGGRGVTRGYLDRPELTAARFRPDPVGTAGRVYDTGDAARWRSDGTLECLGRHDHQVKLRGYRIELGEVERTLESHAGVAEAAVDVRTVGAEPALVAWVRPRDAASAALEAAIRTHLRSALPPFMVPAIMQWMVDLPRTPNGKLDRHGLHLAPRGAVQLPSSDAHARAGAPTPKAVQAAVAQPTGSRTRTEQVVRALWNDVLGRDDIGLDDNFFDLGGHSLLVVRLQHLLAERLGDRPRLTDLYRFPTVRSFAQHVQPVDDRTAGTSAATTAVTSAGTSAGAAAAGGATERARARAELRRRRSAARPGDHPGGSAP